MTKWQGDGEKNRKHEEMLKVSFLFPVTRSPRLLSPTLCVLAALLFGCGCRSEKTPQGSPVASRVTLYCSVDDVYARPIIRDLEQRTGLRIDVLYDTEAAKTAGLAARIRAERERPRGDVFWSSALLQTLLLQREGLLQPYQSPSARDVPSAFKAADGAWTGLGMRARLVVVHRSVQVEGPGGLDDLLHPRFRNQVGISNPQFGSASDWVALLATRWGVARTLNYFRALKKNGVRVLPGNSVVADKVGRGELLTGVTDTDDFLAQARKTSSIEFRGPVGISDARIDAPLVPGSVAMLKGAPHPVQARRLIDALVAGTTEKQLVQRMPGVLPLRTARAATTAAPFTRSLHPEAAPDDSARWPAAWDAVREPLNDILLSD